MQLQWGRVAISWRRAHAVGSMWRRRFRQARIRGYPRQRWCAPAKVGDGYSGPWLGFVLGLQMWRLPAWWWRAALAMAMTIFSSTPAGSVGVAGLDRIIAPVLGFLSCQDKYMSDACLHWSGCSGVFQKAPSTNSVMRFMPGDFWIGWDSVVRTHIFIWPFGFRGNASKLCWLLILWRMFSFHGAGRECHGNPRSED
jgi:hypothetical protein